MVLPRIVKPKTQRAKRALEKRSSKIHENDKMAMFIKGGRTSEQVTQALKDLYALKKPLAVMYKKKNIQRPFEDDTSIEFFSTRSDASLFLFGSHSKKRPHNLVLGRLFDAHVLDMFELGIDKYTPLSEFQTSKSTLGCKPCLVFSGEQFEQDDTYKRLKNMFIDFFRGPVVNNVRLNGLEHVLQFTAVEGKIFLRSFRIKLKKSGHRIPRVELEEMGPSLDFTLRRTKLASDDLFKKAKKQPKEAKPKKVKNVSRDPFGTKLGRIHMSKQDLAQLQLRKLKGLKKGGEGKSSKSEPTEKTSKEEETMDVEQTSE